MKFQLFWMRKDLGYFVISLSVETDNELGKEVFYWNPTLKIWNRDATKCWKERSNYDEVIMEFTQRNFLFIPKFESNSI